MAECKYIQELESKVEELQKYIQEINTNYEQLAEVASKLNEMVGERDLLTTVIGKFLYETEKGILFKPGTLSNLLYQERDVEKFLQKVKNEKKVLY